MEWLVRSQNLNDPKWCTRNDVRSSLHVLRWHSALHSLIIRRWVYLIVNFLRISCDETTTNTLTIDPKNWAKPAHFVFHAFLSISFNVLIFQFVCSASMNELMVKSIKISCFEVDGWCCFWVNNHHLGYTKKNCAWLYFSGRGFWDILMKILNGVGRHFYGLLRLEDLTVVIAIAFG